jgi:tetratricopeptide (TPR) repeat protein
LLIVHLDSPNRGSDGDSIYRSVQPCRALGQLPGVQVVAGSFISPTIHKLLPMADVVVLCDVVEADLVPILRRRRACGLPTLYEINDDFQALQHWNTTAYLANDSFTRSLSSQLAALCDGVQFSTPYLAKRFASLASRSAVFINHLWEMPPVVVRPQRPDVRIGWGGSLGHRDDFIKLTTVMGPILSRYPQATFNVMGSEVFRDLCAVLPAGRWSYRKGGTLSDYLSFISTLDIGVCPLDDTDFNRGRSDVKFLEYASHGVATVAAALPPYEMTLRHGETGLLFRDSDGLADILCQLIENPGKRRELGEAGRAYVREHRLEQSHAKERLVFMEECRRLMLDPPLSSASFPGAGSADLAEGVTSLEDLPGDFGSFTDSSARICLVDDDLGGELLDGLASLRDGVVERAKEHFRSASNCSPRFYLPWLYLANVEEDHGLAVGFLDAALKLNPLSAAALLVRADRLEFMGELAGARADLERADLIAPDLGLPLVRLAELAERGGETERAFELEMRALAQNPYFALPHLRRVLSQIDQGIQPDTASLERCLRHDERYWGTRFVLGRAALAAKLPGVAREHLLVALKYAPDSAPVMAQLARAAFLLEDYAGAQGWLEAAKAHGAPAR